MIVLYALISLVLVRSMFSIFYNRKAFKALYYLRKVDVRYIIDFSKYGLTFPWEFSSYEIYYIVNSTSYIKYSFHCSGQIGKYITIYLHKIDEESEPVKIEINFFLDPLYWIINKIAISMVDTMPVEDYDTFIIKDKLNREILKLEREEKLNSLL